MTEPFEVVKVRTAAVVTCPRGDIAVIRRAGPRGDQFTVPGGNVGTGESLLDGLFRELSEELGLDLQGREVRLHAVQDQMVHRPSATSAPRKLHLVFAVAVSAVERAAARSVEDDDGSDGTIVWMPLAALRGVHLYPAIGEHLDDMIGGRGARLLPPMTDETFTWQSTRPAAGISDPAEPPVVARPGAAVRRLCVYGLAASGKSTASRLIAQLLTDRGYRVEVVKIAEPLYRLQQHVYATAGQHVDLWRHDNAMLRTLATQLRRINPRFLVEDFLARADASAADVVINDDLRDVQVDYPHMVAAGFSFLHVWCPDPIRVARLVARGDPTVVADTMSTWGFDRLTPDWTVDNSSDDPEQLAGQLTTLLPHWLPDHPAR